MVIARSLRQTSENGRSPRCSSAQARGSVLCVTSFIGPFYLKPARNSDSNAPAPFIDDLLDVSDGAMMAMVIQKEYLIEPYTGDDKGARARQAFGGAGFEVIGLDEALEEQFDCLAAIGIEVPLPRLRVRRQLLGGEQPAALLGIGCHQVPPAKRRVPQQEFRDRHLLRGQRLFQHGAFPHRVGTPAGKEGHRSGKDQALQDQTIALHPAAIATLGPCRLGVHVAQASGDPALLAVPLMPARSLGLIHPPINGRRLGFLRPWLHFTHNLATQSLDLGFGLRQRRVEPSFQGPPMRDADKAQRLPQPSILAQERNQLWGFERSQHHPHHRQQQKGQAGEGAGTAPLVLRKWCYIVFFDLLHYLEQCVGGDGGEVGSHNLQNLQRVLPLCDPRPIYAQASSNMDSLRSLSIAPNAVHASTSSA